MFWQAFLFTCGVFLAICFVVFAVVGMLVVVHVVKESYDEKHRRVWKNEPPSTVSRR